MPAERFAEHARLRADAMTFRDTKADSGGLTEADWAKIDELLHASWRSLFNTVNSEGSRVLSFQVWAFTSLKLLPLALYIAPT